MDADAILIKDLETPGGDATASGAHGAPHLGAARLLTWRVAVGSAALISLSAVALASVLLAADEAPLAFLARFDEATLRHAGLAAIAALALLPLAFLAAVWLVALRERRQAEALALLRDNREALRLSRDQMRRVFASLPVAYVLAHKDGTLVRANPQAVALFGLQGRDLSEVNVFDFTEDEDFSEELRGYLADAGRIENFEITMRRPDGKTFWVLYSAAQVEMDGETLLFAAFSDITERKRVEQALQKNETALRAIIDASPIPAVLSNQASGALVYVNQAAAKFFGRGAPELIGRSAANLWESAEQYGGLLTELGIRGHIEDREARMIRADGRPCWVQTSTTVLRLQDDTLIYAAFTDITERKRKESELHRLATTDPLTGALNRRAFTERAVTEGERARRGAYPVSLVICDLDHFKAINDTYGHARGDVVLKRFTAVVQELIRPSDALGRIGGEEFAVLLPGSDADAAARVAERVRARFSAEPIAGGDPLVATASFGVAGWRPPFNLDAALQAADAALYAAKAAGRDCVRVAGAETAKIVPIASASRNGRGRSGP
ncbi:putative Diguanylate cyclase [uncultured Alphaproteobacteria bacterium]|uniref:Putative Diguanylate cyclase n=1 Tax=uncultured Alphaproteobacteria bacterium TaxID=91750 RepID=A0A212KMT7_9PROT|nr:putative Diguanylate cyclase [uncultured Alphaproteobacteria bacterium]